MIIEKMKLHRITVQGKLGFPLDMLRYDCCWPATSDDVAAISESHSPAADLLHREIYEVKLNRYAPVHVKEPFTVDRWRSFGWGVAEQREY